MAIVLSLDDFKAGKYSIPNADSIYKYADVQEAINNYEAAAIYTLLGATEGGRVIAYIQAGATPVNADYNKIIAAFQQDITSGCNCGSMVKSLGLKEYLKAAVFLEYVKNGLVNSQAGVTKPEAEVSTIQSVGSTLRFAENKFNDVLDTVQAIQWYCTETPAAFPDFNGQYIACKSAPFN